MILLKIVKKSKNFTQKQILRLVSLTIRSDVVRHIIQFVSKDIFHRTLICWSSKINY